MFEYKGELAELDFLNNTRKIRKLPKHLLFTLFVSDEIKQIRKKNDFSFIVHKFLELKDKGNKLYKKKKYREALDAYIEVRFLSFQHLFIRTTLLKHYYNIILLYRK